MEEEGEEDETCSMLLLLGTLYNVLYGTEYSNNPSGGVLLSYRGFDLTKKSRFINWNKKDKNDTRSKDLGVGWVGVC